jgi:hypothetical protein
MHRPSEKNEKQEYGNYLVYNAFLVHLQKGSSFLLLRAILRIKAGNGKRNFAKKESYQIKIYSEREIQ